MTLYEITDGPQRNRWCGPRALSAVTGETTDRCAAVLREVTGRDRITYVCNSEMRQAFRRFGYYMEWEPLHGDRPTLAQRLRATVGRRTAGRIFLVVASNHYHLITGRRYFDGLRGCLSIRDARVPRRARVTSAYEVRR